MKNGLAGTNIYLAMLAIGIKDQLAYKLDYLLSVIFRFINALFMILIWTAIYLGTGVSSIRGFTLPDIYVYFFIIYALMGTTNMELPDVIQEDIGEGSIAAAYTRPLRYPVQAFMRGAADDLLIIIFGTVPLFAVAVLISHVSLTLGTVLLLLTEILISYLLVNLIGFLIGMAAVKLINIYGIITITWSTLLLLGGGVVPLNMLPSVVQQILFFSPFPIMLYIPAATFLGTVGYGVIMTSIFTSIAWIAVLAVAAYVAWGKVRRQITSAGG